jgi:hypothetical protein
MKRVPPSEQVRQEISSLLSEGIKGEGNLLTELVTKAVQRVLQEALEQELTDHLGRDHYQRRCEEDPPRGYRNGYEPKRVKTAEGEIQVKIDQVRESLEPYHSRRKGSWRPGGSPEMVIGFCSIWCWAIRNLMSTGGICCGIWSSEV